MVWKWETHLHWSAFCSGKDDEGPGDDVDEGRGELGGPNSQQLF
jgi:hypothetical protein